MKRLTYKPTLVNDPNRKLRCLDGELMCWIGHALQGNPMPNLYSGRLRLAALSIERRGIRTTTTHLLRARTPATAPGPLALPTWSILPERPAPVYTGMRAPEDSDARKTRYHYIYQIRTGSINRKVFESLGIRTSADSVIAFKFFWYSIRKSQTRDKQFNK
jgi:hypothetical protein